MSFLGIGLDLLGQIGETASGTVVSSILSSAGVKVGEAAIASLGTALPYIYSGVQSGLSANQIGQILKDAGLGVRRQSLLGVVKVMRTNFGYPSYIPGALTGDYPDAGLFQFAFGRYQQKYNIVVSVTLRDPLTGEEDTANLTLSSDHLLTLDEIDNQVLAYGPALEGSPKLGSDFAGFEETVGYSVERVFVAP